MKYLLPIIGVTLLVFVSFVMLANVTPTAKSETGDDKAIEKAISTTLLNMRDVGNYLIDDSNAKVVHTGRISDLTSDQKEYLKKKYSDNLKDFVSDNSPLIKRMEEIRQNILNDSSDSVSSIIDNGIFDFTFVSNEISGDSGKAEVSIVGWQKYITKTDSGKYKVVFPVGKTDLTCTLAKESGRSGCRSGPAATRF